MTASRHRQLSTQSSPSHEAENSQKHPVSLVLAEEADAWICLYSHGQFIILRGPSLSFVQRCAQKVLSAVGIPIVYKTKVFNKIGQKWVFTLVKALWGVYSSSV